MNWQYQHIYWIYPKANRPYNDAEMKSLIKDTDFETPIAKAFQAGYNALAAKVKECLEEVEELFH